MSEQSNASLSSPPNGTHSNGVDGTALKEEPSAAPAVAAASTAPLAAVDDSPGPITLRARKFFEEADTIPKMPARQPVLVPLPKPSPLTKQVELSGGVLMVERTSLAWIATGVAVLVGLAVAIALEVDRSATKDALALAQSELATLKTKVVDAEAAAAAAQSKVDAASAAPAAKSSAVEDAGKAKPVVDALADKLKKELARGDAKVVVDGARVTLVVQGASVFDGKKTNLAKRGEELLRNVAAALNEASVKASRVDVVAHTEATAGKGQSEFGQSAARATNVVRFFAEKAGVDGARLAAVGRGAAEPIGKSATANRRVEIVVTPE